MENETVKMEISHISVLPEKLRSLADQTGIKIIRDEGKIYLKLNDTILSCPDNTAGRELAYSILIASREDISRFSDREQLFFRILYDPGFLPDQHTMKRNRIIPGAKRCIVVFQSFASMEKNLTGVLSEMAPMEEGDIIIPVNYSTSALIREMGIQSMEELKEYTEAVIGTMESEGIVGIKAGIGNTATGLDMIRDSFHEGMEAIATGNRFHPRETVYLYSEQALDRILDSIPNEKKKEIRKKVFSREATGEIPDDMLETVRVFFQNDLNLTAASRQLFIHRNTLNYRLDKIKKETGLDLRVFEDAVIFRIISGIPAE